MRLFVGREREMTELDAALDDVVQGHTRVFLIAGEPGIGKTRLANEMGAHAAARGVEVLWGRCWEDAGAPPYWPWVQILRPLLRSGHDDLAQVLGPRLVHLAQIVPEMRTATPGAEEIAPPEILDAAAARFSLFEIVAEVIRQCAARLPAVMVFDDLHAADEASLQLLRFVSRELRDARLLLVGTYRDVEVQRDAQRAELVSGIARSGNRLPLAGLNAEAVAQLLQQQLSMAPSVDLVDTVYQVTEGNPFFVDEVVRLLAARERERPSTPLQPSDLRIPHGVRDAIRERLKLLSPESREVARAAAAIGREFDAALVQRACTASLAELFDRLSEAVATGAIEPAPGAVGRYRFAHGLIRDVLYEEIPAGSRPQLHQRIAAAMEQLGDRTSESYVGELARHFLHAAACGAAGKAASFAVRAAENAAARMAYEDAAGYYSQGLQALKYGEPADAAQRCELLLGLGAVQRAAASQDTRRTFETAAAVARDAMPTAGERFSQLLGRAALGFADHGLGMPLLAHDARIVELLEEALACLPESDSELRARLLGRLSMETAFAFDRARSDELSHEAVAMARRVGAAATLAATLSYRHFGLWRLGPSTDLLEITAEIIQLAERIGHKELAVQGRSWRLVDLITNADWQGFDSELPAQAAAAEELRQPRYLWMTANMKAVQALWRGEWESAEAFAQQSLALGEPSGDPTATTTPAAQMFVLRREQGRLEELEGVHLFFAERFADTPTPHSTLALLYAELDRRDEARRAFERVAADNFDRLQREYRVGILPHLAEVCAYLGDVPRAARLYELLGSYANRNVPFGAAVGFGSGSSYLALLAATMQRCDLAAEHFEHAIEHNRQMQGFPWLARTLYAYANMLLKGAAVGRCADTAVGSDASKAAGLLDEARDIARTLKMARLAQQIDRLSVVVRTSAQAHRWTGEPQHPSTPAPPNLKTPASVSRTVFRLQGDFWCVGDEASPLYVKDSKGTRYLAHLLRHPGREFHATDLVVLDAPDDAGAIESGDRGLDLPALDRRAKEEYKRQLAGLRDQLDEAIRFNDSARAGRLQEEIDFITQELARALGLHGRDRSAGSFSERARLNVTRAIRSVIRRIVADNPMLGRYLETTIRTGTFCSYTPDPRLPVTWEL